MSDDTNRVVVATIHTAAVSSKFCDSMINLVLADPMRTVVAGRLSNLTGPLLSRGRNMLTEQFLSHSSDHGAEWLLWIDSDMVFAPHDVTTLLASADPVERPIVGGLYFIVWPNGGVLPTTFVRDAEGKLVNATEWPAQGLMKCEAVGAGFMLIHRSVLDAVRERHFNAVYQWFQETELDGVPMSEDMTFCLRAGELGFPTHVNTSVRIGHHKAVVVCP